MIKKTFLVLVCLLVTLSAFSQNLKAFISHKAYCTNKMQPYIEFTFIFGGESVNYVLNDKGKYNAAVEVRVDVEKNDSVVTSLHYVLRSDSFDDSTRAGKPDFADIQNLKVPQGEYFLNFYLKDKNSDSTELKYIDKINVNFPEDQISSSKISLFKDMTAPEAPGLYVKYGFNLPPLYYNFVPESQYILPFAVEIYNTDKIVGENKPMTARCFIESMETKNVAMPNLIISKPLKTSDVVLVLDQFNVFKLPSGNYNMVVELYDEKDTLLFITKLFFQRSNPSIKLDIASYDEVEVKGTFVDEYKDRAELEEYVNSLFPISNSVEREFYAQKMKQVTLEQLQRYFYSFWSTRNPKDPKTAWEEYHKKVGYVQERFGSILVKGYRTDRGRVYLQYGQPNDIKEIPNDPVTFPYEIWHYYYLDDQSNVRFVFYDPSMGNDYELLHSNKIGELNDNNWKMKLVQKLQPQTDLDEKTPEKYWGGDIDGNWKYF